jgi:hypothetical protein
MVVSKSSAICACVSHTVSSCIFSVTSVWLSGDV